MPGRALLLDARITPHSENGLQVFDVWDSQEAFEAFEAFGETLIPILGAAEIDPGEPTISRRCSGLAATAGPPGSV